MNFENPIDTQEQSHIQFGSINYDEIVDGEDGVSWYANLGVGQWGLLMDEFKYNDIDVSIDNHAMMGIIDSGNSSIQIPQSMFSKII